jgi:glycosyltransferase involved in cell wall biosynthesis
MNTTAITAVLLKKYFKNSIAITRCHGFDFIKFQSKFQYIPLREFIFKNIDAVYPASDYGVKYIEKEYKVIPKRLKAWGLGTIDHGYNEKISRKIFRIVTCSNIHKVKRVHLIVKALSEIKDISIEWLHFGDGLLRKKIEEAIAESLGKNINVFLKGRIANAEILKFYIENECSLFISASESEGGRPVSIQEALSCGIPVIATNVGGNGEIVKHYENGILINKDFSNEDLTNAIRMFYNMSQDEYVTYRISARKTWEEKCNAERIYPQFANEIMEIK